MNKYEFINNLQRHLTGKVSPQKLQELTRYYSDYIDSEIRKGKSEEEVLRMLGDPRLLAKTIAETEGKESAWGGTESGQGEYADETSRGFHVDVRALLFWIAVILVLCLVLSIVFQVVGVVLRIFVHYILPVLIPVAAIYLIISFLRR
jgi:uncharacterized membrane protein